MTAKEEETIECRYCGDEFPDTIDGFMDRVGHYKEVHRGDG